MPAIKLSQWAKNNALSYQSALAQFHKGQVPGARKLPSGSIVVDSTPAVEENPASGCALYARVSTRKQKEHLTGQIERLRLFAAANGEQVVEEVAEIASGVSDNRAGLKKLLLNGTFKTLYVEYPDRLARFGRGWIEALLESQGKTVVYLNESSEGDDESLAEDLITVVSSFCGRMYGKRGGRHKADSTPSSG